MGAAIAARCSNPSESESELAKSDAGKCEKPVCSKKIAKFTNV